MKKIKIAIFGFGNLGQSVFKAVQNSQEFEIACIFSNRADEIKKQIVDVKIQNKKSVFDFAGKIDVLLVCDGSYKTLIKTAKNLATKFCIVDVFDDHKEIPLYLKSMNKIAQKNKKVAICSCGWDPGIFSLMRAMYSAVLPGVKISTFWGCGLSQGHSNAIRQIKNVENAVEFTVPNKKALLDAKKGIVVDDFKKHKRQCFVVCKKEDEQKIEQEIALMPHYFLGYETTVDFVEKEYFQKHYSKNLSHKGEVIGVLKDKKQNFCIDFKLNLSSNPEFTGFVMLAYARACKKLFDQKKFGSYSVLDIPISLMLPNYTLKEKFI